MQPLDAALDPTGRLVEGWFPHQDLESTISTRPQGTIPELPVLENSALEANGDKASDQDTF